MFFSLWSLKTDYFVAKCCARKEKLHGSLLISSERANNRAYEMKQHIELPSGTQITR